MISNGIEITLPYTPASDGFITCWANPQTGNDMDFRITSGTNPEIEDMCFSIQTNGGAAGFGIGVAYKGEQLSVFYSSNVKKTVIKYYPLG